MWINGLHDCDDGLGACKRPTSSYVCAGDMFSVVGTATPGFFGGESEWWIKQQLESTGSFSNVSVSFDSGRVYVMGVSRIDRAQQRDIVSDLITVLKRGNYNVDETSFVIGIKPGAASVAVAQEQAMQAQRATLERRANESIFQAPWDALTGNKPSDDLTKYLPWALGAALVLVAVKLAR